MNKLVIYNIVSIDKTSVRVKGEPVLLNASDQEPGEFLKGIYHSYQLSYLKFFKMDFLSKLGFLTAEILLKDNDPESLEPEEKCLILANKSSSLPTDKKYLASVAEIPSPAVFVYTLPNVSAGEICIRHQIRGESTFFIQEHFDVDFMVSYTHILFSATPVRQAVVGWLERDLYGGFYSFFASVGAAEDTESTMPFDPDIIKKYFKS